MRKNKRRYLGIVLIALACIVIFGGKLFTSVSAKEPVERYYTQIMVEEGDSLWSIACEYMPEGYDVNDYIKELKQLNHVNGDTVIAGYTLTVVLFR